MADNSIESKDKDKISSITTTLMSGEVQAKEDRESLLEQTLSPSEYFHRLKSRTHTTTDERLDTLYSNCCLLLEKASKTGQKRAMEKILFQMDCIAQERELVKLGVDTFVYLKDITQFIDKISKNPVRLIELDRYEREIPDDVVVTYEKVKDIFDRFYVLFTDYSDEHKKETDNVRKEKDPILFGTFENEKKRALLDRFYFLGDWEDEFCDLTLFSMLEQIHKKTGKDVAHKIYTPSDLEELRQQIEGLKPTVNNEVQSPWVTTATVSTDKAFQPATPAKKKSFFRRVLSAIKNSSDE